MYKGMQKQEQQPHFEWLTLAEKNTKPRGQIAEPVQTPLPAEVGVYPVKAEDIFWLQYVNPTPAFTFGSGFTLTILVLIFEHPVVVFVPVTVNVVVVDGFT